MPNNKLNKTKMPNNKLNKTKRHIKHEEIYHTVPVFEEIKGSGVSWKDYHKSQPASSGGNEKETEYPNLIFMRKYEDILMPVR